MITDLKYLDKDNRITKCSFIKIGSAPNKIMILDENKQDHEIIHTEIFLSHPLAQEAKDELYDKPFTPFGS